MQGLLDARKKELFDELTAKKLESKKRAEALDEQKLLYEKITQIGEVYIEIMEDNEGKYWGAVYEYDSDTIFKPIPEYLYQALLKYQLEREV